MRRAALATFAVACLAAIGAFAAAAAAQTRTDSSVVVAKVDGSIDRTVSGYLLSTLEGAERTGAVLVIQLDTAGTLDQDAAALAERIFEAKVPVIVWVGPAPAKAQGAGLLFMYASSLAAVAPGAGVGPLQPLDLSAGREALLPKTAALQELVVGWASERKKPSLAVDSAFPPSPFSAQAALDQHIAQLAAVSLPDLLDRLDGMTVQTSVGPVELHTKFAQTESERPVDVRFTELGPAGRVLHAVASPAAIYVLLVLGFAGLAFELTQPGFGFAGVSGLAMLGLAFYGLTVVPASWLGLALLVAGIVLLAADVALRRLGVLTALGLGGFLAGSALSFRSIAPAIQVSPWLIGGFTVASLLYYGLGLTVALQSRERITSTQRGLVGLLGETRGALTPEGPVFVKGTLWRGRSVDGPIPAGTKVRVRGVDGLILRVEPEAHSPTDPEAGAASGVE